MSEKRKFTRPVPQPAGTPFGKAGPLWSSGYHTGLDFPAPAGQTVVACWYGTVTTAGDTGGPYGNMVQIRHAFGLDTRYAHLSSVGVKVGDKVQPGTPIGKVGDTGNTTGPHLHLETLVNGMTTNPAPYLNGAKNAPKPGTPNGVVEGSTNADAGAGATEPDDPFGPRGWSGSSGDTDPGVVESIALGARDLTVTGLVVLAGAALVVVGAVTTASPRLRRRVEDATSKAELAASLHPAGAAAKGAKGAGAAKSTTPTPTTKGTP